MSLYEYNEGKLHDPRALLHVSQGFSILFLELYNEKKERFYKNDSYSVQFYYVDKKLNPLQKMMYPEIAEAIVKDPTILSKDVYERKYLDKYEYKKGE